MILGPKASFAAEAYVLGLFQLYPTIYFHKTTRGFEKVFAELFSRVIEMVLDDSVKLTGLPANHPIVKFARNPESDESVLQLDDSVIWGALPLLSNSRNSDLRSLSSTLLRRETWYCFDLQQKLENCARLRFGGSSGSTDIDRVFAAIWERVEKAVSAWNRKAKLDVPRVIIDKGERSPYKKLQESNGPLNQILIRPTKDSQPIDIVIHSNVVAAIETYKFFRIYVSRADDESLGFVKKLISGEEEYAKNKWK